MEFICNQKIIENSNFKITVRTSDGIILVSPQNFGIESFNIKLENSNEPFKISIASNSVNKENFNLSSINKHVLDSSKKAFQSILTEEYNFIKLISCDLDLFMEVNNFQNSDNNYIKDFKIKVLFKLDLDMKINNEAKKTRKSFGFSEINIEQ